MLPAVSYEVVTEEELIESLSFPVYRQIATLFEGNANSVLFSPNDVASILNMTASHQDEVVRNTELAGNLETSPSAR